MVAVAEKHPIAVSFGRRLRKLRETKGWTQAELGLQAGMMYQDVSRMERGGRMPTLETLLKLAAALDVSLNELTPSSDQDDQPEPPTRASKRK